MKTITFYSYKGGVGRSLALANMAIKLSEFKKKVCILDFDLEAPGLHLKFNQLNDFDIKIGIVDYIFDFKSQGKLSSTIQPYSTTFLPNPKAAPITLIPSGNIKNSEYWRKLSSINWYELIYENKNGLAFILDLKEKIRTEFSPDFLLIDSRTGISEMSGITLSLLADEVVIIAANNKENLFGTEFILRNLQNKDQALLGYVPRIIFVISRIPYTNKPSHRLKEQQLIEKIKLKFTGLIDEVSVLHSDRKLEADERLRIDYDDDGGRISQITQDYINLFERLTEDSLNQNEIDEFNKIKKAEKLISKVLKSDNDNKKIELISEAIYLDPSNLEYRFFRISINITMENFIEAEIELKELLNLTTKISSVYLQLGLVLYFQNKFEESIEIYNKLLNIYQDNYKAYLGLANCYSSLGDLDQAILFNSKVIDLDSNNSAAYNNRANNYRLKGDYHKALKDIYKSLELNPDSPTSYATLAEIQAHLGNENEFYLNMEIALKFANFKIQNSIFKESIYKSFFNNKRFINLLNKYGIELP